MSKKIIIGVLVVLLLILGGYNIWSSEKIQKVAPVIVQSQTPSATSGSYVYDSGEGTQNYFEVRFSYPKGDFHTDTDSDNFKGTVIDFGANGGAGKPDGEIVVTNMNFPADFCTNPKNEQQLSTLGFETPLASATGQICDSNPTSSNFSIPTGFNFNNYVQNSLSMVIGKYYVQIEAPQATIEAIAPTFSFRPFYMQ